jgi:dTDP-4-amino-4,6-dideoxygalactose transaminase
MSTKSNPIPFNKPFIAGKELYYIAQAVTYGNLAGDGFFTKKCANFMEERFSIPKVLMTPSCTASLEMAAQLCEVGPGDEVIMPSYTFVSTASAFVRMGAKPIFVDIRPDTLNINEQLIERAITPRTKVICAVHYAGVACEMDTITDIARRYKLRVVEDAAQGVNSWYKGKALGSIGDLGCYSFHETKNFICGEGGALCINDPSLIQNAEVIRDKGTNRQRFFRGEVDKYTWVDVGSSYVLSELCSAFLYAQLEEMDRITEQRERIYRNYLEKLQPLASSGALTLPSIPEECKSNFHLFYSLLPTNQIRDAVLEQMRNMGVRAVFHYVPLHTSPKGLELVNPVSLPLTESLSARLIRMPMYFTLTSEEQREVLNTFIAATSHYSSTQN